MTFTFEQAHAYFAHRLSEPRLPHREAFTTRCPFHGDRTASLSVSLAKGGVWNCHACNFGGGIYDFETRMFPNRSTDEVWEYIYRLTGATPRTDHTQRKLGPVVATYKYLDEDGKLLFEKQRHEPKTFTQRAPKERGWVYSLAGVRKVLYKLTEVMTAKVIFLVEGEKDADNLSAALGGKVRRGEDSHSAAVTCNFDGAGKWRDEYSVYFAGRRVVILPDNDDAGRQHAEHVAGSVARYAQSVKIVELPGLAEKGDVSDYLKSHCVDDLLGEVAKAGRFNVKAADVATPFFVPPAAMAGKAHGVDWLIPGVIHKGAKGLIVAQPKAGKSMLALDLAVALATGQPWLDLTPTRAVTVGVVSREDSASMTTHRLQMFAKGRGLNFQTLAGLRINTFDQKAQFSIQDDADVALIVAAIKDQGIELVILDVLNRLHTADENSNTEMTAVMGRFDLIRAQTGCDVAVIHHDAKGSASGAAKRPRGASSIDSWWDWKVSVQVTPDDDSRKEVFFSSKAGQPHPPVTVRFESSETQGSRIVRVLS